MLMNKVCVGFSTSIWPETESKTKLRRNQARKKAYTEAGPHGRRPSKHATRPTQMGRWSSMHAVHTWPMVRRGPWAGVIVHMDEVSVLSRSMTLLHNPMVACILDENPMAMGHSDFDLDMIHVILDVFDDDRVARSLLWIKHKLNKDLKSFFDII